MNENVAKCSRCKVNPAPIFKGQGMQLALCRVCIHRIQELVSEPLPAPQGGVEVALATS